MTEQKLATRVLRFPDLKAKGVCGSRMTLHRLRQNPEFPKPIEIGGGIGFFEHEIDAYLEARPRRMSSEKEAA